MSKSLINIKVVTNIVGSLIIICGALMSLSIPISLYYSSDDLNALILSSVITLLVGLGLKFSTRQNKNDEVKKREGYLIVGLGWLAMTIVGTLPYVLSGAYQIIPMHILKLFQD